MKPTTLEEALLMVPTHWMLTPGVDVWQDGDEEVFCSDYGPYWSDFLGDVGFEIPERKDALTQPIIARRPIPRDVRESAAWWLLYNTLTTVGPQRVGFGYVVTIGGNLCISYSGFDIKSFESEKIAHEYIESFGGEQRIIKELAAGPDPLGRWILAGKP